MHSKFECLESRFLMSASPASNSGDDLVAQQQAVAGDKAKLATDAASERAAIANDKAGYARYNFSNDQQQIQYAVQELGYDQRHGASAYQLVNDLETFFFSKANLTQDHAALNQQIKTDTATWTRTLSEDQAQLAYDQQSLSAQKQGSLTTTVVADLGAVRSASDQLAADKFNGTTLIMTDQHDSGNLTEYQYDFIGDEFAALQDKAEGGDPGEDLVSYYADLQTYKQEAQQVLAKVTVDTAAEKKALANDQSQLQLSLKNYARDLKATA